MKSRDHVQLGLEALEDRATPTASSSFSAGLEGWTTVRDDGRNAGASALQWRSPGGNPGGFAQATDLQDAHWWYWRAPAQFRGNQLDAAGTHLTFDQRVTVTTGQYNRPDVVLAGGGLTLQLDMPKNPGRAWTPYAVQLNEAGGWKVRGAHRAPTASEFQAVLGNVTDLLIRGEYSAQKSIGALDNVVLGDTAPRLSINSVSRFEGRNGSTPFHFTVSLSHITPVAVTVQYSTGGGTATAGSDYTAVTNAMLRFNPGETSKQATVRAKGDRAREAAETFAVALSSATNAVIAVPTGTGTILNDD